MIKDIAKFYVGGKQTTYEGFMRIVRFLNDN